MNAVKFVPYLNPGFYNQENNYVTCKQSSIAHDKLVPVGKSIVTRLS